MIGAHRSFRSSRAVSGVTVHRDHRLVVARSPFKATARLRDPFVRVMLERVQSLSVAAGAVLALLVDGFTGLLSISESAPGGDRAKGALS